MTIVVEHWQWSGYPAHLCVSTRCYWWLCTRVGDWIISSIGDYRPGGVESEREPIGAGEQDFYESAVFKAAESTGFSWDDTEKEMDRRYPLSNRAST